MKKLFIPISFCLAMFLLSSCAARVAYVDRSSSIDSTGESISLAPSETFKSTAKGQASSGALSEGLLGSGSGILVGIYFTDIKVADKLEVQPEVDFLFVKDLNEIQVPVLLKYKATEEFGILAGPNFGYLLDSDNIKSFNLSIDVGAAYDITEKININARYGFGVSDLSENSFTEISLSGVQIGLGYQF